MADDEQNHTPAQQSGPGGPARGHDNSPENSTELEFQNKMLAMVKDLVQKELHRSTNLPGPSHDPYFSNTDPDGVEPLEKEKNKGHRSKKKQPPQPIEEEQEENMDENYESISVMVSDVESDDGENLRWQSNKRSSNRETDDLASLLGKRCANEDLGPNAKSPRMEAKNCLDDEAWEKIDDQRPKEHKLGPSIFPDLAKRIDKCWKVESASAETVKTISEKYLVPANCKELLVPTINKPIFRLMGPGTRRIDDEYRKIQQNLLCAETAVTKTAETILQKTLRDEEINLTEALTCVLDATTLLGAAFRKLNERRRKVIATDLNESGKEMCSLKLEATSELIGDDILQATKEAEEMSKLSKKIGLTKKAQFKSARGKYKPTQQGRFQQNRTKAPQHQPFLYRGKKPSFRDRKDSYQK
eukprot:gene5864-6557_t